MIDSVMAIVVAAAKGAGVPPAILLAICTVESNLNPHAINVNDGNSPSYGLCQIKTETAEWLGFDGSPKSLLDASRNARVAARYLKRNVSRYNNDTACAIAAYNAGRCNKNKKGLIRNLRYVKLVMKHKEIYDKLLQAPHRRKSSSQNSRHCLE